MQIGVSGVACKGKVGKVDLFLTRGPHRFGDQIELQGSTATLTSKTWLLMASSPRQLNDRTVHASGLLPFSLMPPLVVLLLPLLLPLLCWL